MNQALVEVETRYILEVLSRSETKKGVFQLVTPLRNHTFNLKEDVAEIARKLKLGPEIISPLDAKNPVSGYRIIEKEFSSTENIIGFMHGVEFRFFLHPSHRKAVRKIKIAPCIKARIRRRICTKRK